MKLEDKIRSNIESFTGDSIVSASTIGGGCISNSLKIKMNSGADYFLKVNFSTPADMFFKEANGLNELKKSNSLRVPQVIMAEKNFILLELINQGNRVKNFYEDFGRGFALMHRFTSNSFGFFEDNYIGSNKQINIPQKSAENNWVKFYFNNRILYQLKLAEKNGYATSELAAGVSKLEDKIEKILNETGENPSLLHGDLWGGNYVVDELGKACLIDPAVYYGHREADLAMTKLFGGFGSEFYSAYNEAFPLAPGYEYREDLYKLYHILNHLNLFGRGYYQQAISIINFYANRF